MKFKTFPILVFIASLFGVSCRKDNSAEVQAAKDKELIESYLAANNLTAQVTSEGLYYIIEQTGAGANPTANSTVTVHYEGFLLNGHKFDSSIDRGSPATFPLANVIRGWQIGIPLFKKGGSGKLIIPSGLAYGKSYQTGIPSNSVLVFNVQLIDFH